MTDLLACCVPRMIVGPSGPRLRHMCLKNRPLVRDNEFLTMRQVMEIYQLHPDGCPCPPCSYVEAHIDEETG